MNRSRTRLLFPLAATAALAATASAGCGGSARPPTATPGGRIEVVAAENMWGSIAAQLGAGRVHVTSIVSSAGADPHDYEPTPADARTMAGARAAIVNGAGYDPWASRLLAASPEGNRVVVNVGDLVGVKAGANPHRWYAPGDVRRVIASVTAAYKRLDPGHAAAFDASRRRFEDIGLAAYRTRIAAIRRRFAGVAVGASESIFAPLAQALGLRLLTPSRFVNAVSEGAEPTAADKTTADRQIATHAIAVWVSNGQNTTPDVQRLDEAARAAGIGVVKVTETITPATATFQDWQVRQLDALARALAKATGR